MTVENRPFQHSKFLALFAIVAILITFVQCQKLVRPDNEPATSTHNDNESHYENMNCMNCHYSEGRGEGWFSVAGSINGNVGNGFVHIYDDFSQGPIKSYEVDSKGNFYTTDEIDVTAGKYYSIEDANGNQKFMSTQVFTGQCSLCHGVTTPQLNY